MFVVESEIRATKNIASIDMKTHFVRFNRPIRGTLEELKNGYWRGM